jgi:hypothetical protein
MKKMKYYSSFILLLLCLTVGIPKGSSQETSVAPEKFPVYETFKTYYLVNGHSAEMLAARDLFMNISHRFGGYTSDGIEELFGLDASANIRLEFMYGLTDKLDIGFGRSSFFKIYDGTVKFRAIQQYENGFPFTVTLLGNAAVRTNKWDELEKESLENNHRMSYMAQALISSKITPFLSLQLAPTFVHRNLVEDIDEDNQLFSLGVGGVVKFNHALGLKAEYYHRFSEGELSTKALYHAFGISFDIANERHSYQIQFTNNTGLIGQEYITNTRDNFWDNQVHVGFRIIRKFAL